MSAVIRDADKVAGQLRAISGSGNDALLRQSADLIVALAKYVSELEAQVERGRKAIRSADEYIALLKADVGRCHALHEPWRIDGYNLPTSGMVDAVLEQVSNMDPTQTTGHPK